MRQIMENVNTLFDFSKLSVANKSRIRVTLVKYDIDYNRIYDAKKRKAGNNITDKHLLEFMEKVKDTKHYGTMTTIKWFKELLKGEHQ